MPPLTRRSNRSREDRRDEARAKLLGALEALLEEGNSFAGITVEGLSARAGISRAGFYIHFQDKIDLLDDWLRGTRTTLLEAARGWHGADPGLTRAELQTALAAIVDAYRSCAVLMHAMHEVALYDPTVREDFAQAFEWHFASLTEHISAGQATGQIAPDLPARATAEWLVCLLERAPLQLDRDISGAELERQLEAATTIVWETLYAGAPARRGS